MSDAPIPKGQQSAYQRWEMASFGDTRPSANPVVNTPVVARVTIEEQAEIREVARLKGHAIGLAEGRAEGLEEGRRQASGEADQLRLLAVSLGLEATRADALIADDLLRLTLDLARAMLKTALDIKPELVLPIVTEAIRYLPSLHQPAVLYLQPEDAMLVKQQMHDELDKAGWRIAEDSHLQRGGCRIETASNQIDASLETRWHRLSVALGQNSGWLDP
ncbi:flagellar assembly protein FliH [Actimicrobium sp. GrIS 1.19]|uniref:FliH/SctL family protein n=1 Tax=Actimicrobium sp. GrIS 1.19 TaxID=3071708 RepID=UPI002E015699|nr:flagellar assembly protein FliH [Actimicrobium sp. GrIS 1.19]